MAVWQADRHTLTATLWNWFTNSTLNRYHHETHTAPDQIRLTLWEEKISDGEDDLPPIYAEVAINVQADGSLKVEAQAQPEAGCILLASMLKCAYASAVHDGFPSPDWDCHGSPGRPAKLGMAPGSGRNRLIELYLRMVRT